MALPLIDGPGPAIQTMASRRDGDVVTITYRPGHGSRRKASVCARRYAQDSLRDVRAVFTEQDGDTYVYRLVDSHARLRAQLSESIQNR